MTKSAALWLPRAEDSFLQPDEFEKCRGAIIDSVFVHIPGIIFLSEIVNRAAT